MFPLLRLCYLRDVFYFLNLKMSKDLSDPMFNRVKYLSMTKTSQDFRRWNWRLLILANLWKSDSVWLTRIITKLFVKKSQFLYYFNNHKHLLKTYSFCLDDADERCIFNIWESVLTSKIFDDFLSPIYLQFLCKYCYQDLYTSQVLVWLNDLFSSWYSILFG